MAEIIMYFALVSKIGIYAWIKGRIFNADF